MPVRTNFDLFPSGISVQYTNGPTGRAGFQYIVQAADGRSALACLWGTQFLNLAVRLTHEWKGQSMTGLCGTWNDNRCDDVNDAAGQLYPRPFHITQYGGDNPEPVAEGNLISSSMVNSQTAKMIYVPGEGPETYNQPDFKGDYEPITFANDELRNATASKCAQLPHLARVECFADVGLTGAIEMAQGAIQGEALGVESEMKTLPCEQAVEPTNVVQITANGVRYTYALIDNTHPNTEDLLGCSSSSVVPTGWQVAKNDDATKAILARFKWGTTCVVTADGEARRQDGTLCGRKQLIRTGFRGMCVAPAHCSATVGFRVLIEKERENIAPIAAAVEEKDCSTMLCFGFVDETWKEVVIAGAGVLALVGLFAGVALYVHKRRSRDREGYSLEAEQEEFNQSMISELEQSGTSLASVSVDDLGDQDSIPSLTTDTQALVPDHQGTFEDENLLSRVSSIFGRSSDL